MRSKLIGIFLLLTVKSIESLQIKPNCQNGNFIANTVSGTSISLYYCKIEDAILLEESEVITFNTSANKKADELVEVFWFSSTEFRYLPNIVFERFVNLFYVWMDGKKLQDIQMHYFIGSITKNTFELFFKFNCSRCPKIIPFESAKQPGHRVDIKNIPSRTAPRIHKLEKQQNWICG